MLQLILRHFRLNADSGMYEGREAGSFYQIDPSIIEDLNRYLKQENPGLVADWHRGLTDEDKKKVRKVVG